ncbi:MAG: NPCBM/NEW2 domain-containing protein [Armatimonadota bacterium]
MHGISIALTLSVAAHGWGGGHQVIREQAISHLPAWQQQLLAQADAALDRDCLALQDEHAGGKRPDLDAYCRPEGAKVSLHDINSVSATTVAMRWYLERIREAVQAGEIDDASRYLGVLCHWFEDIGSMSVHCTEGFIDETSLRELIPPPDEKRKRHYLYAASGISDTGEYDLPEDDEYTPVLLGRTIDEAVLHMQRRQRLQARAARQVIIPFVMDEMHGDGSTAARLRGELVTRAAHTDSDLIFTALCLATDRVDADTSHLDAVPLTDFVSDYRGGKSSPPWRWVPFLIDACYDQRRNVVPLQIGDGAPFERGVGMGAPFALRWTFGPAGAYSQFAATVGLHPDSADGTAAIFVVRVDGVEIASTEAIGAGDEPQLLEVALPDEGDAVELTLQTRTPADVSGSGCLAVWVNPLLLK